MCETGDRDGETGGDEDLAQEFFGRGGATVSNRGFEIWDCLVGCFGGEMAFSEGELGGC